VADDKSKRGEQDRRRVSGSEEYEVEYFARKHGITNAQAESLIKQYGNDRVGQAAFGCQLRLALRSALASTMSFRMMAAIATLAGLPASTSC
jgi:hypothetical protein